MDKTYTGEHDYSKMPIQVLVEGVRSLKWKCEDVMHHFIYKAKLAQQKVNCITQFLEEDALKAAKDLDERIAQGEKFPAEQYPLLGLPVSIKDTIDIEGRPTVAGYKSFLNKKAENDSQVVCILKICGGIPFVKTNVPQLCISSESSNQIYGTTLNPNNNLYSPGGSSSGEAALIKSGGSILGIGSDIFGSLRIPASFCGLYAFKPTSTRFPARGHINLTPGQENLALSLGPLANSVQDLEYLYRSVLAKEPWKSNSEICPIPYRQVNLTRKLKVGYLLSDEVFPASPACKRAVLEAVEALKANGHSCTPISYDRIEEQTLVNINLAVSDNWTGVRGHLSDEGIHPTLAITYYMVFIPYFVKYFVGWVAKYLFGQSYLNDLLTQAGSQNVVGLFKVQHTRQQLRENLMQVWENEDLDILLLPVFSLPGFKIGNLFKANPGFSYASMCNAFDMPAGILPVTKVDPKLDAMGDPKTWIQDNLKPEVLKRGTWLQQDLYSLYDVEEMAGLPIGVQVACKRFEDEKCLYAMDVLDRCLKAKSG